MGSNRSFNHSYKNGVCSTDLRLDTSTNGLKQVYTSQQQFIRKLTSRKCAIENYLQLQNKITHRFKMALLNKIALMLKCSLYWYLKDKKRCLLKKSFYLYDLNLSLVICAWVSTANSLQFLALQIYRDIDLLSRRQTWIHNSFNLSTRNLNRK